MAASLPIPVVPALDEVHGGDVSVALKTSLRWNHLISEFERVFHRKPAFIARAPGRVNLIGEHIDYALFGVFPAAIERDILIACAPRDGDSSGHVVIDNLDTKYERQSFTPVFDSSSGWHMEIDKTQLRWESYVKAGYYGVLDHFFKEESSFPVGCDMLVTGTVPAGSGLSSSAAMVVASTLAFLSVNNKLDKVTKGSLVEIAMENERRVGVNSGGMDQAASVISNAHSALYITFHPRLSAEPIPLPVTAHKAIFVCANSLVVSDKVVSSKSRYNLRVLETLVAARVLARHLSIPVSKTEKLTLKQVLGRFCGFLDSDEIGPAELYKGLERIILEVDSLKRGDPDNGFTLEEMVEASGLTSEEFHKLYLSWIEVEADRFQLYKRTLHVFTEALRVLQFRELCLREETSPEVLHELGRLMNESQASCAELFQCSCPELDELTRLAREAGAYGSRLTGAGWGGCTVSLVPEDQVESFIQTIGRTYRPHNGLTAEELHEVIFATKPSEGASVYRI